MGTLAASSIGARSLWSTQECILCRRERQQLRHIDSASSITPAAHRAAHNAVQPSESKRRWLSEQSWKVVSCDGGGRTNTTQSFSGGGAGNAGNEMTKSCQSDLHVQNACNNKSRRRLLQTAAVGITALGLSLDTGICLAEEAHATDVRHLDNDFATLLMKTTYNELAATRKLPEIEIQKQFFRLRQQEYPYFRDASNGTMSSIQRPGDLSEAAYFNFVSYIQWKVVAKQLRNLDERTDFNRKVGRDLLQDLAITPDPQGIQAQVDTVLQRLKAVGYIEGYSVDWPKSSEESESDEPELRVQLKRPADMQGSQLLRAEEGSFWQRFASSILRALFEQNGIESEVDEYFFQEQWQPPKSWTGQLLLALGDPLQTVDVPFDPDVLIQDWRLRPTATSKS